MKHARVVPSDEIHDNDFNLNIPRYVDTFEPEQRIEVGAALTALATANRSLGSAEQKLTTLLKGVGYAE